MTETARFAEDEARTSATVGQLVRDALEDPSHPGRADGTGWDVPTELLDLRGGA